jgi:lysozyme
MLSLILKNILKLIQVYRRPVLFAMGILILLWGTVKIFTNKNGWEYSSSLQVKIPNKYTIQGIDVSHHNGNLNWEQMANFEQDGKKIHFAFIKTSEGVSLPDKKFSRNWEEAKKAGIIRGAYHYYIPWRDPEEQVNLFLKKIDFQKGDLAPVLDIEENSLRPDKKIIADIGTWLKLVENRTGKKPIIYTNQSFYNKFIKGHYEHYPLWIADYSKEKLTLYPEKSLQFWQFTKQAKLKDVEEFLDYNVYLKSEDEFNQLRF